MPNLFIQLFPLLQLTEAQQEERKELILTLMMIIFGLIIATLVVMVVIILFRRNRANKEREEARRRNAESVVISAQTKQETAVAKTPESKQEKKIVIAEASTEVTVAATQPQVQKIEEKKTEIIPEKVTPQESKPEPKPVEKEIPVASPPIAVEQPKPAEAKPVEKKPVEVKPTPAPGNAPKPAVSNSTPEVPKPEPKPQIPQLQAVAKKPDAEKTPEEKLKEIQQRLQELKKDPNANQFKTIDEVKKAAGVESVKLPPKPQEKKPEEATKPTDSKPLSSAAKAEEIRQKIALWAKELKEANESKSTGLSSAVAQPAVPQEPEPLTIATKENIPEPTPTNELPTVEEVSASQEIAPEKPAENAEIAPHSNAEVASEIKLEEEIPPMQNAVSVHAINEEPMQESPIRQLIDEISKPDSYYSEILKSASIDIKAKTLTIDGVKMTFTEWIESLESSNE